MNPDGSAAGSEVWVATGRRRPRRGVIGPAGHRPAVVASGSEPRHRGGQTDRVDWAVVATGPFASTDADSGEYAALLSAHRSLVADWSPDGSRIAYQRGRSDGGDWDQEIWVVESTAAGNIWSHRVRIHLRRRTRVVSERRSHRLPTMRGPGSALVVLVTPDTGTEVVLPDLRLPGTDESVSWPLRPAVAHGHPTARPSCTRMD